MYQIFGPYFKTNNGLQSGPDTLEVSRLVTTLLTKFGIPRTLYRYKMVLEGNTD